MAKDNDGLLISAGLDITQTLVNIHDDIKKLNVLLVNDKNARAKIVGGLNLAETTRLINANLATISKGLKLDIGVINTQNAVNKVSGNLQNVNAAITDTNTNAQNLNRTLAELDDKFVKPIKPVLNTDGLINAAKTIELVENRFRELGAANVKANYNDISAVDGLAKIDVAVKATTGEVRSLTFALDDAANQFNYLGSTYSDKGIFQNIEAITKKQSEYTAKLAQFKSTYSAILSGKDISAGVAEVDNIIKNLGTSTDYTIEKLEQSFNRLKTNASDIAANLDVFGKSFNKTTNAINNYKELDTTLTALKNSFNELSNKPRNIKGQIDGLLASLQEIRQYEQSGNGTDLEFSKKYRDLIIAVKEAQNQVKLLHQAEKSDNSEVKNQAGHYQKILQEMKLIHQLKVRLISAGTSESEELRKQIKRAQDRQRNAEKYIVAKQLENAELKKEVESLDKIYKNEEAIVAKRREDKINQQQVKNTEQLAQSVSTYKTQLDRLSTSWQNQGLLVGDAQKRVDKFYAALSKVKNIDGLRKLQSEVEGFKNEISSANSMNKELTKNLANLQKYKNSPVFVKNSGNVDVQASITRLNELQTKYQQIQQALSSAKSPKAIQRLKAELTQIKPQFDSVVASAKNLQASLKNTNDMDALAQKIRVLISQIEQYMAVNTKAVKSNKTLGSGNTVAVELNNMLAELKACSSPEEYQRIASNFRIVRNEVKRLGIEGKTVWGTFTAGLKKFGNWFGVSTIFMRVAREIRDLFTDVAELDTALVDLRKTFKGTDTELKQFYFDANDVAKQLGVTTKEVINSAAEWSRLGYNTAQSAEQMAKMASIMKSVSPGMDMDTATKGLVSIVKAFDIDTDDVLDDVISKINVLGNNFAESNADIVEGLQRSSAAMNAMGATLDETLSLFTAGQEIVQDASLMGNALRSISLRVRGYDEETEQLSEDLADITGKVIDLTKVASNNYKGVSLFTDTTQTEYKSIYNYLVEIADIYDEIGAKERQDLLEKLFGKNRAQAGAAILQNIQAAKDAMSSVSNGAADGKHTAIMYRNVHISKHLKPVKPKALLLQCG